MQYEVYRHTSASDASFNATDAFFKQVEGEDKFLCENAQKNLEAGGYVAGPLHPHNEKGVLHFQSLLKRILTEHRFQEGQVGATIIPSRRMPENQSINEEDIFCASLCNNSEQRIELKW